MTGPDRRRRYDDVDIPSHVGAARRRRLLALGPGDTVRIHSFQHPDAWDAALLRGYWAGDPAHVAADEDDPVHAEAWREAYAWMRERMVARLPDASGDLPVWAWLRRPNLRRTRRFASPTVMLVADVPVGRVLLSEHGLWHGVLSRTWVSLTEDEYDGFAARHPLSSRGARVPDDVTATWDRVFDLRDVTDPERAGWTGQPDHLQACVDRVYLHEVVSVRPVTGRLGGRHA